ncbi:hypothetical protein SDC9_151381 [bioreactor metagenome]|uniref:Uncharacterized protein n=1 Tax=bioreactor metagenome TaxID=1076179 RepID=A0A645EQ49_9ZZZZ
MRHDANVQRQQQFRATAKRPAVDRADGGLVADLDVAKHAVDHLGKFLVMRKSLAAVQIADVASRHKRALACPGQHDDAHARVLLEASECVLQCQQRRHVKRVQRSWPVDGQDAHGTPHFTHNDLLTHGICSWFESVTARCGWRRQYVWH